MKDYLYVLNHFSHVRLFATLWTVVCQTPLSMGFSRQEHWIGLPCPPPGDIPNRGIKPASPGSAALTGWFFTHWATWVAFPNMWDNCYYWYGDDFRYEDIALNYIGLHRGENYSLFNLVSILLITSWGMSHFGMKIYLIIPDFW